LILETRDPEHIEGIRRDLRKKGYSLKLLS